MNKPYNELIDGKSWRFTHKAEQLDDLDFYVNCDRFFISQEGDLLNKYIYGFDVTEVPDDDI